MSNEGESQLGLRFGAVEELLLEAPEPTADQIEDAKSQIGQYLNLPTESQSPIIARFEWDETRKPSIRQQIRALKQVCEEEHLDVEFTRRSDYSDFDSGRITNFDVLEVSRKIPTA